MKILLLLLLFTGAYAVHGKLTRVELYPRASFCLGLKSVANEIPRYLRNAKLIMEENSLISLICGHL